MTTGLSIEYIRGGTCPVHELIWVPKGYPKCPDHPIWLGVFEGSWYDIGKQFGQSEGVRNYITPLFDYWFGLVLEGFTFLESGMPLKGGGFQPLAVAPKGLTFEEVMNMLHTIEGHVNLYEPHFIEACRVKQMVPLKLWQNLSMPMN